MRISRFFLKAQKVYGIVTLLNIKVEGNLQKITCKGKHHEQ